MDGFVGELVAILEAETIKNRSKHGINRYFTLYLIACHYQSFTDKKENKIFLIFMDIQMGSGAMSYVYEEGLSNICMRKCANFSSYMMKP